MAVDEKRFLRAGVAESPCYLKTTSGNRYLARFEVKRTELNHAFVSWELTGQRDKALVFCSEAGAGMVAVLFERYVRANSETEANKARFFHVLPLELSGHL